MSSSSHPHRLWPLALIALLACDFSTDPDLTRSEHSDAGSDAGPKAVIPCETFANEQGVCAPAYPVWGCLGMPDARTVPASPIASLKVKVLYAFAQGGARETGVGDLSVRVCNFGDVNCDNLATEDWSYDSDNFLVIKGLEAGLNYRIQLQGTHPAIPERLLLPVEYLMYRTVVGETVEPKPILMFEEQVRDFMGMASEVKVDPDLGFMLMRIFDCSDLEVAGVQVSTDKPTAGCGADNCPTTVFYQDTSNIPAPRATETNSAGRAGIFNLRPGVFNRITLMRTADSKKITSFMVTVRAGWVTYLHMWPWDYGTGAD